MLNKCYLICYQMESVIALDCSIALLQYDGDLIFLIDGRFIPDQISNLASTELKYSFNDVIMFLCFIHR
jgi:hypothetical protein